MIPVASGPNVLDFWRAAGAGGGCGAACQSIQLHSRLVVSKNTAGMTRGLRFGSYGARAELYIRVPWLPLLDNYNCSWS